MIRRGGPLWSPAHGQHRRVASTSGNTRLGLSTQFVVGPAGESDRELLTTAQSLYREIRLARAYSQRVQPDP